MVYLQSGYRLDLIRDSHIWLPLLEPSYPGQLSAAAKHFLKKNIFKKMLILFLFIIECLIFIYFEPNWLHLPVLSSLTKQRWRPSIYFKITFLQNVNLVFIYYWVDFYLFYTQANLEGNFVIVIKFPIFGYYT